ncbi:MAG: hydrogenase iron-sulfur subunit [Kiritimatiellaeota bacterium]|nr:hydrogenase iron-sulfur subunit [Kiritimatiellota bacterium]
MSPSVKKDKNGVGVILCDCAGTLAKRLDFQALAKAAAAREGVAAVQVTSRLCNAKGCLQAVKAVAAKGCRRLVLAACEREIFDPALNPALKRVRIGDGLATFLNIREQCAWVHADPAAATRKANALINAAVERAVLLEPIASKREPMNRDVLILGGDLVAMQTALCLARMGHKVTLASRRPDLGGSAARMIDFFGYLDDTGLSDSSDKSENRDAETAQAVRQVMAATMEAVRHDPAITFIGNAALRSLSGDVGRFVAAFTTGEQARNITAGAVALACGELESFPFPEHLTGKSAVMNLAGLAERLHAQSFPKSVAIFLDLAAEQGRIINALALTAAERLARSRRCRVLLFARHIRVAAWGLEALYRRAREAGVLIMRYKTKPKINAAGNQVDIEYQDIQSGAVVTESVECAIMADARLCPGDGLSAPGNLIRRGPGGAAQADNVWLTPVLANRPGLFVVGLARGNSEFREALNDAAATAAAIQALLASGRVTMPQDAATVDPDRCVLCLTCLRTCPHGAIRVDAANKTAAVSAPACRRCGLCTTMCPAVAIQMPRFTDEQMRADIGVEPDMTVFACEHSAWPAATLAGVNRAEYSSAVRLIRVPCLGKVDARQVLQALERGAKNVTLLGCHRENCRYLVGADHGAKRVARLRAMLTKAGIDGARLRIGHLTEFESGRFLQFVKE